MQSASLPQKLDALIEPFLLVRLDLPGLFPQPTNGNEWIAVATNYETT